MFIVMSEFHREWDRNDPAFLAHRAGIQANVESGRFLCSGRVSGTTYGNTGIFIDMGDDEEDLRRLLDDEYGRAGYVTFKITKVEPIFVSPASGLKQPELGPNGLPV
jgi:uncharacterized protein YciI